MSTLHADVILCDLGDTFIRINKLSYALHELGLWDIVTYGLYNGGNFNPQKRIFETLEKIGGTQTAVHDTAMPLPQIYCNWMAGHYEDAEATRTWILEEVDKLNQQEFFRNASEYRIISKALTAMFSPDRLVRHLSVIQPMVDLLARIDTTRHTLVAVTNWDQHSFEHFLASPAGHVISRYIKRENMIVSGHIKHNKPHDQFFDHVFEKYGQERSQYLFIDNELCNVKQAEKLDLAFVHFTGSAKRVEEEFIKRNIIRAQ